MSALGMNDKGEVRTASEFKSVFEDDGHSYRPYRCPFCEVLYEDRCIITECVRAPHFKLPDETSHRGVCNGEAGEDDDTTSEVGTAPLGRKVVGKIDIPEALVKRRKALTVRRPGVDVVGLPPDAVEVARRRKLIAADKTISSCHTSSHIRPLVHAYKRLLKHAAEQARAAQLQRGTAEYNASFRDTLNEYGLSLYGQKLTYRIAFQGFKLQPNRTERLYNGYGRISIEERYLVIKDAKSWPLQAMSKADLVPFTVKVTRIQGTDASTSQLKAMQELEQLATEGINIEWYAYGLPRLEAEGFELTVDSMNHIYWPGQHGR